MGKEKIYMNTWMVPKNKRNLIYIIQGLSLFVVKTDKMDWKGNRPLQKRFEEALESSGLKNSRKSYDSNSGGARTYAAQFIALGLVYIDNVDSSQYRPTLAGEAILKGCNPLAVLQNQLLKFQYPSVYSKLQNVNLSPDFQIRPFLFILRLLLDSDIIHLTKEEVGKFVIVYAKKDSDYDKVKKIILDHRQDCKSHILPENFLNDSVSSRTKNHSIQERIAYLEDKANIFFNYLESLQLVIRPDNKKIIQISKEYESMIKSFIAQNIPFLKNPDNKISFQRQFGRDLNKKKDTRSFGAGQFVSSEMIEKSLVKNQFFKIAKNMFVDDLSDELLEMIHNKTGVCRPNIIKYLDDLPANGLAYFEESYIEMSNRGKDKCTEFEKATQQIFEKVFKFVAKHLGQAKPKEGRGGYCDVLFLSSEEKCCGIIDTKADKSYSLSNDHKNRMLVNYIHNYSEHSEGFPMKAFVYVAGGFSNNFEKSMKDLAKDAEIGGSGISAKNLLRLSRKVKEQNLAHRDLLKLFASNKLIDMKEIDCL